MTTRRQLLKAGVAFAACGLSGRRIAALPGAIFAPANGSSQAIPPGRLPSRSDVVMSTRVARPDALEMLSAFHATRNEWLYTNDAAYVARMKQVVGHVGLSVNLSMRNQTTAPSPDVKAAVGSNAARNLDGSIMVAPWMGDKTPFNSTFDPNWRTTLMNTVKNDVAIGADSIQGDDPEMETSILRFAGGDFSSNAIAAFQSYCKSPSAHPGCRDLDNLHGDMSKWIRQRAGTSGQIDWKDFKQKHGSEPAWEAWTSFMREVTVQFLGTVRQYLHSQQRPLPFSINVNNPLPIAASAFLFDSADYLISEINSLNWPRQLTAYHATTAAWKMPFVPSIVPISTADTQWAIALAYALGDTPLVPWNVFVVHQPRYFGSVADYGYLFDFVRANSRYFDDYDEVSDVAVVCDENSITPELLYSAATVFTGLGVTFRFVVLRSNGTITGTHPTPFPAQVAVALNVPESRVKSLFPSIPSIGLSELSPNGFSPALDRALHTVTPNPQRVVAVPRIDKASGTLLVHVVDATKSNSGFSESQFLNVIVPKSYWAYVQGVQRALLVRPRANSLQRPVTVTRNSNNITLRVSLAGISGWGMLVFQRS